MSHFEVLTVSAGRLFPSRADDLAPCFRKRLVLVVVGMLTLFAGIGAIRAGAILVPNGSFESPETDFANPVIGSWQKAPEPAWYMGGGGFPWDQLVGEFLNTTNGSPNRIENMDGSQGAFLFALPDVAIFQDYNSVGGTSPSPIHDLNARFEAGKSYALTVGMLGGGGGMSNGATFQISLYYRDVASNVITVATTTVTNSQDLFPTNTRFVNFQARTPIVRATDTWAGKHIGIRLASTTGFDLRGGYWDLDNVRLTASVVPNGSFESPETDFASPTMSSWQKAPEPPWYMGGGGFPWEQLVGEFLNTTNGSPNHIANLDGSQGAFLFALPEVAIFQDYNSIGGSDASPTHDLNARFTAGKSYALTVGLLGGGGGMSNGATFQISLYYRDAASNVVTVASTTITNSQELFPTNTRVVDFQARTPRIQVDDAWAGKYIGIRLASTTGFDRRGGYWDLDNVRLTESVVPNGSFESPATDFAGPEMDSWQKAPEPPWYMGGGGFPWDQLIGQFQNTTNGSANRIDNMDGKQAAFLFALPEVAIFQDHNSIGGTNRSPTGDFNARFEVGKAYVLTVGLLGGGGGMSNGVTFQMGLYYRDAFSNRVTLASTTVTNNRSLFPTGTHFTDFQTIVPTVKAGDVWADENIGIQLGSTVGFDLKGGYWDIDNVRLAVVRDPVLTAPAYFNDRFQFTLESAPGLFEILTSTNLAFPTSRWTRLETITNFTGSALYRDTNSNWGTRYYQMRQVP